VRIVRTPLTADFRADVDAMRRRITSNTIAIVGSAPCYPYGVIDPIEETRRARPRTWNWLPRRCVPRRLSAAVGRTRGPGIAGVGFSRAGRYVHFGGRSQIWLRGQGRIGRGLPVDGIPAASILRGCGLVRGSVCVGLVAGHAARRCDRGGLGVVEGHREDGFMDNARRMLAVSERFRDGIRAIPPLEVLGDPPVGVMAIASHDKRLSVFAVADFLGERGWHVDRLQYPESIHLILNPGHEHVVDEYLEDLRAAVAHVQAHPDAALEGSAPMYGLVAKAPMRRMVKRNVLQVIERLHSGADDGGDDATRLPAPLLRLMRWRARLARLFGR